MTIRWLQDIGADDVPTVGGKAASLGELAGAGFPVPPAFVVTAATYRRFIEGAGIADELFSALSVDPEDSDALGSAADRASELILQTDVPDDVREAVLEAFDELAATMDVDPGDLYVAVRSSATAEDLPEASFAGQQETFLNVSRDDLLDRVVRCWASLFSQRAIYYRADRGFDHRDVDIAVVVQAMIDAEKSGVLFTSHPSTGDPVMVVEAAWGLGEAVVSGSVSPDNYVVDAATGAVEEVTVADKRVMHVRAAEGGQTVEQSVPEDRRAARVLTDDEIERLRDLGTRVEEHYGTPQDVEWSIGGGRVYLLQSRPITTIEGARGVEGGPRVATEDADGGSQAATDDVLISGLGASPGSASGPVRIVRTLDELDKVEVGDVLVTEMTMPDMVPAMRRAVGIVTDEGGMTSHASIVSRELGVPAVVGTRNATTVLADGQVVTVDGDRGTIREGSAGGTEPTPEPEAGATEEASAAGAAARGAAAAAATPKPLTATDVFVNLSIPEAAPRAAATGADGVGLLRLEGLLPALGKTPARYIEVHGERAYEDELIRIIRTVADEFYPRPVRVRTIDAPTDEFRELDGGDAEPIEHNPMLGYRGIRRSLDRPEVFRHELGAFARLFDMGYDNIELMFPLVTDAEDVLGARRQMEAAGIDPDKRTWGVMIETPASALVAEDLVGTGIDFASFGTNDLTQYTLAVDRNNELVADRFDEMHPAVLSLIRRTIDACRAGDVKTSICGQAGSYPPMVRELVRAGISSISANIDAVRDVQHEVKRVEQRLLLEAVRRSDE